MPSGDPAMEIVPVMETNDRVLWAMAKGLLDEAGLAYWAVGDEVSWGMGMVGPIVHRSCTIFVGRDVEAEARTVLQVLEPE